MTFTSIQKKLNISYRELASAFRQLKNYCDEDSITTFSLSPRKTQGKLISLLKPLHHYSDNCYIPEADPFEFEMQTLLDQGYVIIRQLKKKPDGLIRAIKPVIQRIKR